MANKEENKRSHFSQYKGIIVFVFLLLFIFAFRIIKIDLFDPKLGQDALYLDALDTERSKAFLEIYDPDISFKVDLKGLPDNILRSQNASQEETSYVSLPSGRLSYTMKDIDVNRQRVVLGKNGKVCVEKSPHDFLTFQRLFRSGWSSNDSYLGYGWTHNFNYQLHTVGEVYTVVDWQSNIYTFSYDYREERFQQIYGLSSRLAKEGTRLIWTSPGKNRFEFDFNDRFSSYTVTKIKTVHGKIIQLDYDEESGRLFAVRETGSNLALSFKYGENGYVSQVSLSEKISVQFSYDDNGNLSKVKAPLTGTSEEYMYDSIYNVHDLTGVKNPQKNIAFSYGPERRVKAILYLESGKTEFDYDDILGIIRVKDLEGHTFKYISEGKATLKILDPLHNENFFFYDSHGLLVKAVYANGSYDVMKYNDGGQIIEKEVAPANITYFDYDQDSGFLSKDVNALGKMIKYEFNDKHLPVKKIGFTKDEIYQMEYDPQGRLSVLEDPSKNRYSVEYDRWGNVKKVSSSSGWEQFYEYDILGRLSTHIDAEGSRLERKYDDRNFIIRTIFPDGSSRMEKKDAEGRIIERTENKINTQYKYNKLGYLSEIIDPLQRKAVYQYDKVGNLLYEKDFSGKEREFSYDDLYRLIFEKSLKTDSVTRYEYAKESGAEQKLFSRNYTRKVYPDGEVESRKFDSLMRVVESTESDGKRQSFSYDKMGNIIRIRENDLYEKVYSYDAAGNMESVFLPVNNIFLFEYNWRRQITAAADPEGHTFIYYYDKNGRLSKVLNAEKQTSALSYDNNGNLTQFQFPSGLAYQYGYDEMNRLISIGKGENDLTEISYDIDGQISSIPHSSGVFELREHNAAGLMTSLSFSDETVFTHSYDSLGRLNSVKGPDFSKYYEYDDESRVSRQLVNQQAISYSYTKGGKISKVTYPDKYAVSYEYDTYGRIKEMMDSTGDKVIFKYGRGSQLQSVLCSNRVTENYGYDEEGKLSRMKVINWKDEKIFDSNFTYNALGFLSEISFTQMQGSQQVSQYEYDSLQRIIKEKTSDKGSEYRYDANGNVLEESTLFGTLKRTFATSGDNYLEKIKDSLYSGGVNIPVVGIMPKRPPEYVNVENTVCQIDKKKNMFYLDKFKLSEGKNSFSITAIDRIGYKESIKVNVTLDGTAALTFGYHPSGNLKYVSKKGTLFAYEWNHQNRIEKIINDRREMTSFGYDDKKQLASLTDDYGDKTQFIYDADGKLMTEIQGKNTISSKYVYRPDGRILFKVESGGKKYFYHLMPDKTVKVITDRFGNIAKQYSYDSFGKVTDEGGRIKSSLLFKGMFYESISGMYFNEGRYYSPEFRMFAGGGLEGVHFTENHQAPNSALLGVHILQIHPDKQVYPLEVLRKRILFSDEH